MVPPREPVPDPLLQNAKQAACVPIPDAASRNPVGLGPPLLSSALFYPALLDSYCEQGGPASKQESTEGKQQGTAKQPKPITSLDDAISSLRKAIKRIQDAKNMIQAATQSLLQYESDLCVTGQTDASDETADESYRLSVFESRRLAELRELEDAMTRWRSAHDIVAWGFLTGG
ncbi:hypothetical protein MFIFM68171_02326 [Madurella fahalii]|uniref:Uncharacterized protein n=1 Tax=Madurella fahalii TaxID=1157608 RepID=A0ABQ0G301_9PEZI